MANEAACLPTGYSLSLEAQDVINAAVGGTSSSNYFTGNFDFCAQPQLQTYLLRNGYHVHRCEAVRETQTFSKACMSFTATAPPAFEVG